MAERGVPPASPLESKRSHRALWASYVAQFVSMQTNLFFDPKEVGFLHTAQ